MKNKQIIDSWGKIAPDTFASRRMLGYILENARKPHRTRRPFRLFSAGIGAFALAGVAAVIVLMLRVAPPDVPVSPSHLPGNASAPPVAPSSLASPPPDDTYYMMLVGEINGAYIRGEYGDGTPLYKSGNISISAAEVLSMSKVLDISNTKDSARTAAETLLRREALAWAAVYAGYTATDEEVWAYLNNEREQFAEASNRDGFLVYLSAAKLTEDEYWQFQFDTRRATFVSGKHLEAEREAFFAGKESNKATQRLWEEYVEEIARRVLKDEGVDVEAAVRLAQALVYTESSLLPSSVPSSIPSSPSAPGDTPSPPPVSSEPSGSPKPSQNMEYDSLLVWVVQPTLAYNNITCYPAHGSESLGAYDYIGYMEDSTYRLDPATGEVLGQMLLPAGGFSEFRTPYRYYYDPDGDSFYYDGQYDFLPEDTAVVNEHSRHMALAVHRLMPAREGFGSPFEVADGCAIYHNGRFVSDFVYGMVIGGNADVAFVNAEIHGKFAMSDTDGALLTGFVYDEAHAVATQNAAVCKDGFWGMIDLDGNELIPFIFHDIENIGNNTAFVKYNGKYGILDTLKTAQNLSASP